MANFNTLVKRLKKTRDISILHTFITSQQCKIPLHVKIDKQHPCYTKFKTKDISICRWHTSYETFVPETRLGFFAVMDGTVKLRTYNNKFKSIQEIVLTKDSCLYLNDSSMDTSYRVEASDKSLTLHI